jgi:transposase-like protein
MTQDTETGGRTEASPLALVSGETAAAFEAVRESFERFCLMAGIEAMEALLQEEAVALCGERHGRAPDRQGHRWGMSKSPVGYHGGKVSIRRPRVRRQDGGEMPLASWRELRDGDLLQQWAYELMLLGVATRRYGRAVRLEAGDVVREVGDGTSKSAVSRRFVALSQAKLRAWLSRDLSELDLLVIQIDGMTIADHTLIVALGVDSAGHKHPLAIMEGATENAVVTRALIADLKARGLPDDQALLWVIDGAKAIRKAITDHFGRLALIQRCQIHKARNILERLPPHLQASTKKVLRQAFTAETAAAGRRLLENLAQRLDAEAEGVAGSILEGIDDMLTCARLGLPEALRRSLVSTNMIENLIGRVRQLCKNVRRWRDVRMVKRWTVSAMIEAKKGMRRLRGHRSLPILQAALRHHQQQVTAPLDPAAKAA